MRQEKLFHDGPKDALEDTVNALGGPKVVSAMLWPSKDPTEGAKYIRRWFLEDRHEKPALDELVMILEEAARKDCHVFMHFLSKRCGYTEPEVVNPEDERAKLQRQFNSHVDDLSRLAADIKRLG